MRKDDYPLYDFDTKLLKPMLVAFYNLHLRSGPVCDDRSQVRHEGFDFSEAPFPDGVAVKLPDENEQSKIVAFFAEHCKTANSALESIEGRIEDWNWFEEGSYMRFADDYHYAKQLVNAYIDSRSQGDSLMLHTNWIGWLKSRLGVRVQEAVQVDHQSVKIEWKERTSDEKKYYYGPPELAVLMGNFHEALRRMLHDEWALDRCVLEGCDNIFIIGPRGHTQKYCSKAHKMVEYRKRKKADSAGVVT